MHRLENEYGDRINFVYLDIDDPANKEIMQALGRRGQPEYVLLDKEGNILHHWFSVVPEGRTQGRLSRWVTHSAASSVEEALQMTLNK